MSEFELPEFTRRTFLSRAMQALGAAVVLPMASSSAIAGESVTTTTPALKVLTLSEYAVLAAIADTYIPHGGAFDMGATDVDLARRIDSYLPKLHPDVVTGVRGALVFVEQQAPALAKKQGTFTALSGSDRTEVLQTMSAEPGIPASVFVALKFMCCNYFYSLDATWKYTGYDGPMLLEVAR